MDTARVEHELLWTPSPERIEAATVTRYQRWLADAHGVKTDTYEQLWRWSVNELEAFWRSIVEFFELRIDGGDPVLGAMTMPGATWFPGSRVSYAEHIFAGRDPDAIALHSASELRELSTWSWGELRSHTAAIAAGLRAHGVGRGDRVVAYMPNIPETLSAFLACASIGAIWSSAAPEFGSRSVIDRFDQIEPKVMLAVDGYRHGGKDFDRTGNVERILEELPTVEHTVVLEYLAGAGESGHANPHSASGLAGTLSGAEDSELRF